MEERAPPLQIAPEFSLNETMMAEEGFDIRLYDPFFHPDTNTLEKTYDFVTCTETAEHFKSPRDEFQLLGDLVNPGGWLGVMTGMLDNREGFHGWYYYNDPTHIAFYSTRTMRWIAEWMEWDIELPAQNVALFRKP